VQLQVGGGLGTHLFVKVPRPGDSEVTFSGGATRHLLRDGKGTPRRPRVDGSNVVNWCMLLFCFHWLAFLTVGKRNHIQEAILFKVGCLLKL